MRLVLRGDAVMTLLGEAQQAVQAGEGRASKG